MLEAPDGSVYLTAFEKNAIVHFDPGTRKVTTITADELIAVAGHPRVGT